MSIQSPRGTQDLLPGKVELWQYIEEKVRTVCSQYNYKEIRTPMFESTELFKRGVGETTDIVQKEMYTLEQKGKDSLTLRPEGTASAVRAYVQHKLFGAAEQPTKLYYMGPMFRYERPQAGRFRQFSQFGVEVLGSDDPSIDAEVISLAVDFYQSFGLKKIKVVLNSLGDKESRMAHREALVNHFKPSIHEFCSDCQNRIEKNPLRVLDCKKDREHELMKSAPAITEYLNEFSQDYFTKVKSYLDACGIEYVVDPNLVRGLDYYYHTVFEIMSDAEGFGAITTLSGGGRYTGLVEQIGGPDTPGVGFGVGLDRLINALDAEGIEVEIENKLDCYLVSMGEAAKLASMKLLREARNAGLHCDKDYQDRKMKAQFKSADRNNARFVGILGDDELAKGIIMVKELATGKQEEVAIEEFVSYIKG